MELRIDRLTARLRDNSEALLAAIDADPLLTKREAGGLVLANASKQLFTPSAEHQLFAKGIVYQRDPYRLVSLPLLKIYNLGERNVTAHDLTALAGEGARLHFLRKFDGTMIQRFEYEGQVWFTTRGMLPGASLSAGQAQDQDAPPYANTFDYIGTARRIAHTKYPELLVVSPGARDLTLVLELLHPDARVITDYGGREDLVLLAVFDKSRGAYWPLERIREFATEHRLTTADAYTPVGTTLAEQIDSLLATLAGTDEEGTVLVIEEPDEVVYRVKIKTPDYLRLLRLMVRCTYAATVEMLDSFADFPAWPEFDNFLQAQGSDKVPEEVLGLYREHYDAFVVYRADCERLRKWALDRAAELRRELPAGDPRSNRKAFAERAKREPHAGLLFSALDGRLSLGKVREYAGTPAEVGQALAKVPPGSGA
ncbi:MAG TPA: hypothetical protein VM597_21775 [Gemmataceae bacterium]|jgi:hypothetical protein|nr:hypothetical protein [Gemmataceae bacterium]